MLQKSVQWKPSYSTLTDMTKPIVARYNNVTKHQYSICANCFANAHKSNRAQSTWDDTLHRSPIWACITAL